MSDKYCPSCRVEYMSEDEASIGMCYDCHRTQEQIDKAVVDWRKAAGKFMKLAATQRTQIDALEAEIARLQAIVDKLPKTADKVSVAPLMVVYLLREGEIFECPLVEIDFRDGEWLVYFDWDWYSIADECYSTHEVAEAASAEGDAS